MRKRETDCAHRNQNEPMGIRRIPQTVVPPLVTPRGIFAHFAFLPEARVGQAPFSELLETFDFTAPTPQGARPEGAVRCIRLVGCEALPPLLLSFAVQLCFLSFAFLFSDNAESIFPYILCPRTTMYSVELSRNSSTVAIQERIRTSGIRRCSSPT